MGEKKKVSPSALVVPMPMVRQLRKAPPELPVAAEQLELPEKEDA